MHGTWVCEQRIEPLVPIEMVEGDVMRLGASTRVYKLQWVSLSEAYEIEYPMQSSIECNGEMQELNQVLNFFFVLDLVVLVCLLLWLFRNLYYIRVW